MKRKTEKRLRHPVDPDYGSITRKTITVTAQGIDQDGLPQTEDFTFDKLTIKRKDGRIQTYYPWRPFSHVSRISFCRSIGI